MLDFKLLHIEVKTATSRGIEEEKALGQLSSSLALKRSYYNKDGTKLEEQKVCYLHPLHVISHWHLPTQLSFHLFY
ncbi:hypothetical protein ISN45_Aa07g039670, partial [Arabidopsis thaliana x Arabidopsis arenosa]